MRIGLDFDGVIADTIPSMVAYAREHLDLELRPEECVTPGGRSRLGADAYREFVRVTHTTPFALTFRPTEGALDWLPRLAREHELVVVTAREDAAFDNATRWLRNFGLDTAVSEIHSSRGPTKAAVASDLNLACFVDDLSTTFERWPQNVRSLLWDASYNRAERLLPPVQRIRGWSGLDSWLTRR